MFRQTIELLRTPPVGNTPKSHAYLPELQPGAVIQPNHVRALRSGPWKLVRYCDPWSDEPAADEWELYNLAVDPTEICNLVIYNAPFPTIITELPAGLDMSAEQLTQTANELLRELARQEAARLSPYPSAARPRSRTSTRITWRLSYLDQAHRTAATRAGHDVDREHPLKQPRPRVSSGLLGEHLELGRPDPVAAPGNGPHSTNSGRDKFVCNTNLAEDGLANMTSVGLGMRYAPLVPKPKPSGSRKTAPWRAPFTRGYVAPNVSLNDSWESGSNGSFGVLRGHGGQSLQAGIMPKLEVGDVNDPLEREADAIADRVMRMPTPSRATNSASAFGAGEENLVEGPTVGAFAGAASLLGKPGFAVQRGALRKPSSLHAEPSTDEDFSARVHSRASGGGMKMSASTREFLEPRLGANLDGVRLHADSEAGSSRSRSTLERSRSGKTSSSRQAS